MVKKGVKANYHREIVKALEKARKHCESLSMIEEHQRPLLSEGYAQLGDEIGSMLEYLNDLGGGQLSEWKA